MEGVASLECGARDAPAAVAASFNLRTVQVNGADAHGDAHRVEFAGIRDLHSYRRMDDLRHDATRDTMWIGKGVKAPWLVVAAIVAAGVVVIRLFGG